MAQKTTITPSALPGQTYNFLPKTESGFEGMVYESDVKVRMITTTDVKVRTVASSDVEF